MKFKRRQNGFRAFPLASCGKLLTGLSSYYAVMRVRLSATYLKIERGTEIRL